MPFFMSLFVFFEGMDENLQSNHISGGAVR